MTNQITAITFGLSLAVMLLTMNAVNVSLATTHTHKPSIQGETNTANTAGGSQSPDKTSTKKLPECTDTTIGSCKDSGDVSSPPSTPAPNPGCNGLVGGGPCGGPPQPNPACIAPIGGPPCGPTPTSHKKPLCPISTNNMSNTCIFILHRTVVKHENTITSMPVVVVNGMQLQLLNCTIVNSAQVLCDFQGMNIGALLK
jgi:hypothetical protein